VTGPHQLVFVGGLHRSGTTPLARALAGHPEVSGLTGTGVREDEGQHLQAVYPKAKVYGGSGHFAFEAAAHLTEHSPLVSAENARQLRAAWDPYWNLERTYLVEKSPPNMIMGRFLQALFPGSSLVVVVRHPVVVALSNKKWRRLLSKNWKRYATLRSLVAHWVTAHEILLEDAPHLERLHVVRYENLVARPAEELGRLGSFLGLSTPLPSEGLRAGHSVHYEAQWAAMRSGVGFGRLQRRLIEAQLGERVTRFGYDLQDLHAYGSWPGALV
jgi:hypothetical protein